MITTVVGAQWGDEGKGKIVDYLTQEGGYVARYNGGANAGHSVVVDGERHAFHLLPAGALKKGVTCLLGRGMAIEPGELTEEIMNTQDKNPTLRVMIDPKAQVVHSRHRERDRAAEDERPIGSTLQGIGPAYADRALRTGSIMEAIERYLEGISRVSIRDVGEVAYWANRSNADIVISGAHGVMLDIAHGHYPYVTSSGCLPSDVGSGLGIDPRKDVDQVVGVVKAYTTLIGTGPMAEMDPGQAAQIRENGFEYGTTTGRPRRIGWLDIPALKYANRVCGFDYLAITRIDVLDNLTDMSVITGYDGRASYPETVSDYHSSKHIYKEMTPWRHTQGVKDIRRLPSNARDYIRMIEQKTGIPVKLISTGPDRDDIIDLR